MTAFRLPIVRSLPPTANVWAKYVGDGEAEDYPVIGLLLHLLYGAGGGIGFGVLYGPTGSSGAGEPEERGVVLGAVYGLLLSVIGSRIVLPTLADAHLDRDELALFHASHLIYGVSLGAWVGSRAEGTNDPEADYDYEADDAGLGDGLRGTARELVPPR